MWAATPIKISFSGQGQWGSCHPKGGAGRLKKSPGPRLSVFHGFFPWPCREDASGQIASPSQEKFWVISEAHVYFWMVRAIMCSMLESHSQYRQNPSIYEQKKNIYIYCRLIYVYIKTHIFIVLMTDTVSKTSPSVLVSCRHAHVLLAKRFKLPSLNLWKCSQCLERKSS